VVHIAQLHQFFQVIGYVRALIVAARFQLARGDLILADVEQQQRLNRVDFQKRKPLKLILDDVKQQPVQPFHQREVVEIAQHHGLL